MSKEQLAREIRKEFATVTRKAILIGLAASAVLIVVIVGANWLASGAAGSLIGG